MGGVIQIEIYKLFRHPLTFFITSLCLGLLSLLFYRLCVDYLHLAHQALQIRHLQTSLFIEVIKPLCSWSILLLALVFPLFTTQAFSLEFKQKTFYLWAMSPLKAYQLVLGKGLSLLLILLMILSFLIIMIGCLAFNATLSWKMIVLSLLIIALAGSCFISLGLFISSLIKNPLFSLGSTYLIIMMWMLFEWLNPLGQKHALLAKEISLLSHCYHGLNGIFYSQDIFYFLMINFLCFIFCSRRIKYLMTNTIL